MPTADAARRRRRASVPEGHHARSTSSSSRTTTRMTRGHQAADRASMRDAIPARAETKSETSIAAPDQPQPRRLGLLRSKDQPAVHDQLDATAGPSPPPTPRSSASHSPDISSPRHLPPQGHTVRTTCWRQDVPARRPVPFRQPTQPADAVASPPTHPGTGTTNQSACSSWSDHCLGVPSQQSSTVLPGPRYCTAGRLGTT